jgi:hypothetical protein
MRTRSTVPSFLPRLSPGAHRSPRRGACFMEFASFLAGEHWSDHPSCTDPILASLARAINDSVSDARRDELVVHIPRVIGLRGDDSVVGLMVALRAAIGALPVASMDRQRSLALGILAMRAELQSRGVTLSELYRHADAALGDVPDAAAWARDYLAVQTTRARDLHRAAAEAVTRIAATGIAKACMDDPDSLLIETLLHAIGDVESLLGPRELPAPVRSLLAV